jgi:hypothetical protein
MQNGPVVLVHDSSGSTVLHKQSDSVFMAIQARQVKKGITLRAYRVNRGGRNFFQQLFDM